MSAATSGSNATPNGSATSREHKQGKQERKYTLEQKTAVIRVRRCSPTAFYEILALEKSATDGEIKKAYRKLSLLTHPDKNGYDGADEAFKMVSRAFQILSDPDKKSRYDQFGGDPDNRFSASGAGTGSPFSGFSRSTGQGGGFYEDEISPEELFNRFFGGGGMGGFGGPFGGGGGMGGFGGPFGGGMFGGGAGPQFVFNMGGGPGFTVHRFGGGTPRRRPRPANGEQEPPPSGLSAITQLLPLLLLFVLPLFSSLFSGSTSPGPSIRYDPAPPNTMHRTTPKYNIDYFINPAEVDGYSSRKFHQLDQRAEVDYINVLQYNCEVERNTKQQLLQAAQGWFSVNEEKMRRARSMPMRSCSRLDELRIRRQY